ncbi:MAG: transglycosylase SLT domain-containing protein [Gemmatimonadota bacterium]|nr:MAG: transglycosylase SLT domain-containing protein [Gemmatimonadota bacterium]
MTSDFKRVSDQAHAALLQGWNRLPATQRLMMRGMALLATVLVGGTLIGGLAPTATADHYADTYTGTAVMSENHRLRASLDTATGELELVRLRLARSEALLTYSTRYRIPADLAALVFDVSIQEGLDPELAFRLVNLESGFNPRAKSKANAYGLAQVQVGTARFYKSDVTAEQLYEPELNLRIGFRFLRDLIETYDDINLALLAYNRGPSRVQDLIDAGVDPDNGYPETVMEGYSGR